MSLPVSVFLVFGLGACAVTPIDAGEEPSAPPGLTSWTTSPTSWTGGTSETVDTGKLTTYGAWISFAVAGGSSCGVRSTGEAECWGEQATGLPVPGPFRKVAVRDDAVCGLKIDGSIECWGCLYSQDCAGPPGVFLDIDTQNGRFCAVDDLGATCWNNSYGDSGYTDYPGGPYGSVHQGQAAECGLPPGGGAPLCWATWDAQARPPKGLELMQMDPGSQHVCGIETSGGLTCWGSGAGNAPFPVPPSGKDWVDIASASSFSCGLRVGGAVECFGVAGDYVPQSYAPAEAFVQLDISVYTACGLTDTGDLHCWGTRNESGQLDVPP